MGKVTTKYLAEYVGVSKMTISLYLRDPGTTRVSKEVKNKIDTAMKELNYVPSLKTQFSQKGKTNIIAVIMPFNNPFFKYEQVNEILSGLQGALFQNNYSLIFLKVGIENGMPIIDRQTLLQCKSFDGVVFFGTRYTRQDKMGDTFQTLKNYNIPFVVVNMPEIPLPVNQVIFRNDDTCTPIEYLFSQGHSNIVFMGGVPESYQTAQALEEYTRDHKKMKHKVDKRYILNGGFESAGAYVALGQFIKTGMPFTAIYCISMQMTAGCYKALKEEGFDIPGDVSIIGFGDPYFSELLDPPLSVVHPPLEEVGTRAASILIENIAHPEGMNHEKVYLQNSLVIRRSTSICGKVTGGN